MTDWYKIEWDVTYSGSYTRERVEDIAAMDPDTTEFEVRITPLSAADSLAADYRWRVVHSSNGEIMASGEGCADRRDRDHSVNVLFPGVEIVEVER